MTLGPMANSGYADADGKKFNHTGMTANFKKRFDVRLMLTRPIMLLPEMVQHWCNIHISFSGSKYFLPALSSVVFFHGGWPFF